MFSFLYFLQPVMTWFCQMNLLIIPFTVPYYLRLIWRYVDLFLVFLCVFLKKKSLFPYRMASPASLLFWIVPELQFCFLIRGHLSLFEVVKAFKCVLLTNFVKCCFNKVVLKSKLFFFWVRLMICVGCWPFNRPFRHLMVCSLEWGFYRPFYLFLQIKFNT